MFYQIPKHCTFCIDLDTGPHIILDSYDHILTVSYTIHYTLAGCTLENIHSNICNVRKSSHRVLCTGSTPRNRDGCNKNENILAYIQENKDYIYHMYYLCIYDHKHVLCRKSLRILYVERHLNILNMILHTCDHILAKSCMVRYKILFLSQHRTCVA